MADQLTCLPLTQIENLHFVLGLLFTLTIALAATVIYLLAQRHRRELAAAARGDQY